MLWWLRRKNMLQGKTGGKMGRNRRYAECHNCPRFPLLLFLKGTSCPQVCYTFIIFPRQHHNSGFEFLVAETESNMSRCSEVRGTYKNKQTSTAIVLLPPGRPLRMTTSSEYYDETLLLLLFVTWHTHSDWQWLPAAKSLVLERPELLWWWWWGDRIEFCIL